MADLYYATFTRLVPKFVPPCAEFRLTTGELVRVQRKDIGLAPELRPDDDAAWREFFRAQPQVLVEITAPPVRQIGWPQQGVVPAVVSDPWLQQAAVLAGGQPLKARITDATTRLYVYGEAASGLAVRCDRANIRQFLQDLEFLPPRLRPDQRLLTKQELGQAKLNDDAFWRTHYSAYELYAGDTVVGILRGVEYEPEEDRRLLLLDLAGYLRRLETDDRDVFRQLGLEQDGFLAPARSPAPEIDFGLPEGPAARIVESVLIVDDDEAGRKRLAARLRREGAEVVTFGDANNALDRVLARRGDDCRDFDVAFIDINLTRDRATRKYEGIRFAYELQQNAPGCALILMSGERGFEEDAGKSDVAGNLRVQSFEHKPIPNDCISQVLRQALRHHPVPARSLFREQMIRQLETEDEMDEAQARAGHSIEALLAACQRDLGADLVALFRMDLVARECKITAWAGKIPQHYERRWATLRYSPVRDVAEDLEAWCLRAVPSRWSAKHANLLSLWGAQELPVACAACPVAARQPEAGCALFAFARAHPLTCTHGVAHGFPLSGARFRGLRSPLDEDVHDVLALACVREYAAGVASALRELLFTTVQVRQHPIIMAGSATTFAAHDLIEPLEGLTGAATNLAKEMSLDQRITEQHLEFLKQIHESLGLAKDTVDRFWLLLRPDIEDVSVFDLREVITLLRSGMSRRGREDRVQWFHPDHPLRLRCRRGIVERVLFNVLLNAMQQLFLSLRGRGAVQITYGLRRSAASDARNGQEVVIRVYDSGPGIHGYRRQNIFELGETTRPNGSGLGLHLCREELKRLGAEAAILVRESFVFCGSCFEIVLPGNLIAGE